MKKGTLWCEKAIFSKKGNFLIEKGSFMRKRPTLSETRTIYDAKRIVFSEGRGIWVGFLFSRCYKFPGKTGNVIGFPGIPGNSREITLFTFKQNYTQSTSLVTLKIT